MTTKIPVCERTLYLIKLGDTAKWVTYQSCLLKSIVTHQTIKIITIKYIRKSNKSNTLTKNLNNFSSNQYF